MIAASSAIARECKPKGRRLRGEAKKGGYEHGEGHNDPQDVCGETNRDSDGVESTGHARLGQLGTW